MDKSGQAIRECLHNHDLRSTMVQDGPPPPPPPIISETVVVVVAKPTPIRTSARVSKKAKLDLLTSKLLNFHYLARVIMCILLMSRKRQRRKGQISWRS
jgi:hypothetical protein